MPTDTTLKAPEEILVQMAHTFAERNAVYADNWTRVGDIMAVFYPDGVTLRTAQDFEQWHVFTNMVGKLGRFAASGRTHIDSVHDIGPYAAIMESLLR